MCLCYMPCLDLLSGILMQYYALGGCCAVEIKLMNIVVLAILRIDIGKATLAGSEMPEVAHLQSEMPCAVLFVIVR